MARIVLVSYRLGGTDGVAIEAEKWITALESLGHRVRTVAGEGEADVLLPGLAMYAPTGPSFEELNSTLEGADLVIVENIASLPLNVAARDALYHVLDQRPALFHHHDLPWQREAFAHLEGPRDQPRWRHVTINELSRRQLCERGVRASTLMNSFECDPPPGRRDATRRALGVGDERLVLLATRAIARKNVGGALELCAALAATLWILGPSEDGYGEELEDLVRSSGVDVRQGALPGTRVHDAYAACDLVVMPSTWEGFGNPVLESVTHRRPLALHPYPVAEELRAFGFDFFRLDDVAGLDKFLDDPDAELFERNLAVARAHFNLEHLPGHLARLVDPLVASAGAAPTVGSPKC